MCFADWHDALHGLLVGGQRVQPGAAAAGGRGGRVDAAWLQTQAGGETQETVQVSLNSPITYPDIESQRMYLATKDHVCNMLKNIKFAGIDHYILYLYFLKQDLKSKLFTVSW